jgi:tRNA-specific adenosine deaminase 3
MALALGLGKSLQLVWNFELFKYKTAGSLFNHSESPNVSFLLDTARESIRYTTVKDVEEGEEMCIFYGHKLWFEPAGLRTAVTTTSEEENDGWGGLFGVLDSNNDDEVVKEEDLPFEKLKPPPEEETLESIRTGKITSSFFI